MRARWTIETAPDVAADVVKEAVSRLRTALASDGWEAGEARSLSDGLLVFDLRCRFRIPWSAFVVEVISKASKLCDTWTVSGDPAGFVRLPFEGRSDSTGSPAFKAFEWSVDFENEPGERDADEAKALDRARDLEAHLRSVLQNAPLRPAMYTGFVDNAAGLRALAALLEDAMRNLAGLCVEASFREFFGRRGFGPCGIDRVIREGKTFKENAAAMGEVAADWLKWLDGEIAASRAPERTDP